MPVGIAFTGTEFNNLQRSLKKIEQESPHLLRGGTSLTQQFSKEMRSKLNPVAKSLSATIPPKPPLSKMNRNIAGEPWGWKKPRPTIRASKGKRPRPNRPTSAVSIRFRTKAPNHGFYVAELAGSRTGGYTPQGRAFIRNLNAALPIKGGLGRTVIPAYRDKGDEITKVAEEVVGSWVKFINRNLRSRGRI